MFKVSVFWNVFTPQIATRVIRDCLAIQRLARVNNTQFVIACDEGLHANLKAMGVDVTKDYVQPNMVRAYLINDDLTDDLQKRLPECEDTEIITVTPLPAHNDDHINQDLDPYAGVKLFKDWKAIPETLPLEKAPPKGPSDPMWSPWL